MLQVSENLFGSRLKAGIQRHRRRGGCSRRPHIVQLVSAVHWLVLLLNDQNETPFWCSYPPSFTPPLSFRQRTLLQVQCPPPALILLKSHHLVLPPRPVPFPHTPPFPPCYQERQSQKDGTIQCAFRLAAEGLRCILPFLTRQLVRCASLPDFLLLLRRRSVAPAALSDPETRRQAEACQLGCLVMVLVPPAGARVEAPRNALRVCLSHVAQCSVPGRE